jgi:hypothetical protein
MGKPMTINILQGDRVDTSTDYRGALAENVSAVLKPMFGADGYMREEPGLTQYATGNGTDRGGVWNSKMLELFRVSGGSLITVAANGGIEDLGAIEGTGQAAMPFSFQSQAIVTNGSYWRYTVGGGLVKNVDVNLGEPIDCVWVDGYYFFTDGEYLFHTDLADEMVISPLQFATSEFSPDPTVGLGLTTDNKVIAMNRYSMEFFANAANEFFAFTRIPSRNVSYGLVGTFAKAQIGGEWFFMGGPSEGNISIYQLDVGTAKNIASRDVDKLIAQYTETQLALCKLETRIVDNYPALIVRLPNETLMYNFKLAAAAGNEQAWTILKSTTGTGVYRAINGVFDGRLGKWVYGDVEDSKLGYLDQTVATHYGQIVECVLYTPFVPIEAQCINQVEVKSIPGHTATDDATVFLSLSYDGNIYSMESSVEYGAPSAYNQRFIARRLGYIRNYFNMKLRWTSRSRMAFCSMVINHG